MGEPRPRVDPERALVLQEDAYRSLLRVLVLKGDLSTELESLMESAQVLLGITEDKHLEMLDEVSAPPPPVAQPALVSHPPSQMVPRRSLVPSTSFAQPPSAYDARGRPRSGRASHPTASLDMYEYEEGAGGGAAKKPKFQDPYSLVGGTVERYMDHLQRWEVGQITEYDASSGQHHVQYTNVLDANQGVYQDYHRLDGTDSAMRNVTLAKGLATSRPAPLSLTSPPSSAPAGGKARRPGGSMYALATPVSVQLVKSAKTTRRPDSYPSVAQLKKSELPELHKMAFDIFTRENEIYGEMYDSGVDENSMDFDEVTRLNMKWERLNRREVEVLNQIQAMGGVV